MIKKNKWGDLHHAGVVEVCEAHWYTTSMQVPLKRDRQTETQKDMGEKHKTIVGVLPKLRKELQTEKCTEEERENKSMTDNVLVHCTADS